MTNMPRTTLPDRSLLDVAGALSRKDVSPVELTREVLERIEAADPSLNAFVTVLPEPALVAARQAEADISRGDYRCPLHGIPVSVKDLFATRGIRTTAGSRVLAESVPDEDATAVERLAAAGAILVGKTNMLEFAYASAHPDFGTTKNPWDLVRSTAGSSSGSAAAVAAGMGFGSLGTDTGGSIRIPAAYCGVVGLKPTYGRVSRHGVVPVSWSCDHIGPMTRTVADAAAMLRAIAGIDPRDSTSGTVPVPDYLSELQHDVAGVRIGIADAYLHHNVDAPVRSAVQAAIVHLENLGATIVEVALPAPTEAVPALLGIITPEATEYHLTMLRERADDYSAGVRERLELGAITPAVSYIRAQRLRRQIVNQMRSAFAAVDVIAMPTAPTAAIPLDEDLSTSDGADPDLLAATINFTGPFDLTGFPALSIPCGFTPNGLPIGMQLVAAPYEEARLLAVAHAYEQSTNWHKQLPAAMAEILA